MEEFQVPPEGENATGEQFTFIKLEFRQKSQICWIREKSYLQTSDVPPTVRLYSYP